MITSRQGGPECYAMNQRMTIMDKPVQHMTWRELKDTVANILLEWPAFLDRLRDNLRSKQNLKQVLHLVNLCAARFGKLAYLAGDETLLDDVSEMVYTGGTSFRFKCTWHGSAESLVKTIAAQCMEDGEWGAAPGNGSFVYPTRDGNQELGVLRYANVVAV